MGEFEQPKPITSLPTEGLTEKEDKELTHLLNKWKGGRISTEVFTELARMIPQPIVEVVILRDNNGRVETLLIPRPKDDIVWPGKFHSPGAALRAADFLRKDGNPLNGPFERIQQGELNSKFADTPTYVERFHRMEERGPAVSEVYIATLPAGTPTSSDQRWVAVERLKDDPSFIQGQLPHILRAADTFRKMQAGRKV
ncbi:MAG TPA: hypothetical protein VJB96_01540 [Patescibacteria group bacterium]|nr:hypothetical protein [Patescibacteria group bacterium]